MVENPRIRWSVAFALVMAVMWSLLLQNMAALCADASEKGPHVTTEFLGPNDRDIWERTVFRFVILAGEEYARKLGVPAREGGEIAPDDVWFCGYAKFPRSLPDGELRYCLGVSAGGRSADPYYFTVNPDLARTTFPICFPLLDTSDSMGMEPAVAASRRPWTMWGDPAPVVVVMRIVDDRGPDGVRTSGPVVEMGNQVHKKDQMR